jgi:hypothetical protein
MGKLSASAIDFLESWIAWELLCEAPSGEAAGAVIARFEADARASGLSDDELAESLRDPDVVEIIAKHAGED